MAHRFDCIYRNLHQTVPCHHLPGLPLLNLKPEISGITMPMLWLLIHGRLCNTRYPPETHFKPKSYDISFVHNVFLSSAIISKFCTKHDSVTVVLWAKCRSDWRRETDGMDERDFARLEFKMSFGRTFYLILYICYNFKIRIDNILMILKNDSHICIICFGIRLGLTWVIPQITFPILQIVCWFSFQNEWL